MAEEPGKRWHHTIHYSIYYNNIYIFYDLDKYVINHVKKTLKH